MTISLAAEPVFTLGNLVITNTWLMSSLLVVFIISFAIVFKARLKPLPVGSQNVVELVIEKTLDFMDSVTGDAQKTRAFFPLVFTIFIFILFANWLELLPGLGSIGVWGIHHGHEVLIPFIRSPSADLNFTLAIAILAVLAIQYYGVKYVGAKGYAKKFFNFSSPILLFVGLLELISEFSRIISFSFRLFGNIFAGEILLMVIAALVPLIAPIPFLFLEIFVGFIQALVFSMLTLVFLTIATSEHH